MILYITFFLLQLWCGFRLLIKPYYTRDITKLSDEKGILYGPQSWNHNQCLVKVPEKLGKNFLLV